MIKITDLKPGTKIKLKTDLEANGTYGGMFYNGDMDTLAKKEGIVEIESIHETDLTFFHIKECLYNYTPEMVECVVMNYIRLTK